MSIGNYKKKENNIIAFFNYNKKERMMKKYLSLKLKEK